MAKVEFFGATNRPYGIFSNFYTRPITIDNTVYPTVEHYYQSQKFDDVTYSDIVRSASTPYKAKLLASQRVYHDGNDTPTWRQEINEAIMQHKRRGVRLRTDWEDVKEAVMATGLRAKFEQHVDFRKLLLKTDNREIVEASPYDSYWGLGRAGNGQNRLGHLLMELRTQLRTETLP